MFVVSEHAHDWGTGKLLHQGPRVARVEYFEHPGPGGVTVRELPVSGIRLRKLEPQTRVLYRTPEANWRNGRVVEVIDNLAEVQFGRGDSKRIDPGDLYIRCRKPIPSPVPYLTAFLSDPRRIFDLRRNFLREAIAQRAAAAGLEGLVSAGVELLPHQMNVVRRVLTDPVQRYLLADEVGLGKTIEASAIIRQRVIDDPEGHRVAVIVPEALVGQWRSELTRRFHLGPPFLDDSIQVVHSADDALGDALSGVQLIVVDEAHRLIGRTAGEDERTRTNVNRIREACKRVESLLLLSATPSIVDEHTFFELMQLIDPEVYSPGDRAAFHARVENRQELAQIIAGFDPSMLQLLVDDGQRLQEMFPEDRRLAALLEWLEPIASEATEPDQPELVTAVQAVRDHLRETYRLHRRILRNRRKNVVGLTPPRMAPEEVQFEDATAGRVTRQLENWRIGIAARAQNDPSLDGVYVDWLHMLFERPTSLREAVLERLESLRGKRSSMEEIALLEQLAHQLQEWDPLAARCKALQAAVEAGRNARSKLIVFCSDAGTAGYCYRELRARYGPEVVRHDPHADEDPERDPEWSRFNRDEHCWLLVCDARAEEGLNLQGGRKAIIHVDLPLSPNRVEQRLGRVDRIGSGDPIRSYVLTCTDSTLERQWVSCLIDGFGVMERSIASLQYLVDAEMKGLERALVSEGVEAIVALTSRLGGSGGDIRRELLRIDQQDELEALQSDDAETFEPLLGSDSDWRRIRNAVEPWLLRGLQFARVAQPDEKKTVDEIVRYRHSGFGDRGTLIPSVRFRADFLGAIDPEVRHARAEHPTTHRYAYRRQTSVTRGTHLVRSGDPLWSGLLALARNDDRGKVHAIWSGRAGYTPKTGRGDLFFRCEVLVEADLDPAMAMFPNDAAAASRRRALGRRLDLILSPEYRTVWLERSLEPVPPQFIARWLDLCAESAVADVDLDFGGWARLRADGMSEALLAWPDLVERAFAAAKACAMGESSFRQRSADAARCLEAQQAASLARIESRVAILQGREQLLEQGRLAFESELGRALVQGVREPRLHVDAIGVVFLAGESLR